MTIRDWFRRPDPAALELAMFGPSFAVDETAIDPAVFGLAAYAAPTAPMAKIDRRTAMQVPAVKRSRDLVCTVGQIPVDLFNPQRAKVFRPLFAQPERNVPRVVSYTRLVEDMLMDQVGWWRVVETGWHTYPTSVKRISPNRVTVRDEARCQDSSHPAGCSGTVSIDGRHVADSEVIRFDSPTDGLLTAGARAIRTALALDAAAYRNADGAPPVDYFTPEPGSTHRPTQTEVDTFLDTWTAARRERSTAYVPASLKYANAGWSPEQLQMAEARAQAVLEIARLCNVDPEELGVAVTSRTYANQFDRRKQFTDFTLGPFMTAIADRLSMPDVTPTGYYAKHDLSWFLRSDDETRYRTAQLGIAVGALTPEEVRAAEDKPPLTQEGSPAVAQPQPLSNFDDAPAPSSPALRVVNFDTTTDLAAVSMEAIAGTVFAVDTESRTIRGRAVPYGVIGTKAGMRFQFSQGTIHPREGMAVKLWALHDKAQASGVVTKWDDTPEGLDVTFRVGRGPEGDRALQMADDGIWDGLSIGPSEGARYELRDGVYHSVDIPIHEISLTPAPVFGGARVQSVAFDAEKGTQMKCTTCGVVHAPGVTTCQPADLAAHAAASTPPEVAPVAFDATQMAGAVAEGFRQFMATAAAPQNNGVLPVRQVIDPSGTGAFDVREPSPYRFDGIPAEHCFTQDLRDAYGSNNSEARQRLETFIDEAFAVTVANAAAMNPTQNRPDLYVPNLTFTRPLWDMVSKGVITDKTPFTVPKFNSASGLVGNHTEGVEPTPGTFTATSQTVTPGPLSGKIEINREVWDQGGNPQTDAIIWGEMQNGYYEAIEAKIAALLATTATAELNLAGAVDAALVDALVAYFAGLQFVRGGNRFTATAADSKLFLALTAAKGTDNRKLLPVLGPTNAQGTTEAGFDTVAIGNQRVAAAWALAQGGNTRSYNFVPSSVFMWASAPKRFTFEYQVKSVDMAVWGYAGGAILRDSDVKPVDYDTADV